MSFPTRSMRSTAPVCGASGLRGSVRRRRVRIPGAAPPDAGLRRSDVLPGAAPFGDGIENLLKYAFNMDLSGAEASGLPYYR